MNGEDVFLAVGLAIFVGLDMWLDKAISKKIKKLLGEREGGLTMTNGEKYANSSHNHYVFERMCPKCTCFVCGREPSDFNECLIKDERDYTQWLLQEVGSVKQNERL
jgi:hypothetical protein